MTQRKRMPVRMRNDTPLPFQDMGYRDFIKMTEARLRLVKAGHANLLHVCREEEKVKRRFYQPSDLAPKEEVEEEEEQYSAKQPADSDKLADSKYLSHMDNTSSDIPPLYNASHMTMFQGLMNKQRRLGEKQSGAAKKCVEDVKEPTAEMYPDLVPKKRTGMVSNNRPRSRIGAPVLNGEISEKRELTEDELLLRTAHLQLIASHTVMERNLHTKKQIHVDRAAAEEALHAKYFLPKLEEALDLQSKFETKYRAYDSEVVVKKFPLHRQYVARRMQRLDEEAEELQRAALADPEEERLKMEAIQAAEAEAQKKRIRPHERNRDNSISIRKREELDAARLARGGVDPESSQSETVSSLAASPLQQFAAARLSASAYTDGQMDGPEFGVRASTAMK